MPFQIRKIKNQDLYTVKNTETGKIHSNHATKANAKKQVRLLQAIDHGMIGGIMANGHKRVGLGLGGVVSHGELKNFVKASYKKKKDAKIEGYELDRNLSTKRSKVYTKDGKAVVTHAGTDSLTDWANNLLIPIGLHKYSNRYKEAKKVQEKANKKYGKENIETVSHSQSGHIAKNLANEGITKHGQSTTLNPAILNPFDKHRGVHVIKSSGDIVSALTKADEVIKAKTYNPLKEHSPDILGGRKPSAWIQHIKNFAKKNNVSYGCALSMPECKKEYHQKKQLLTDVKLPKKLKPIPAPKPKPAPKPAQKADIVVLAEGPKKPSIKTKVSTKIKTPSKAEKIIIPTPAKAPETIIKKIPKKSPEPKPEKVKATSKAPSKASKASKSPKDKSLDDILKVVDAWDTPQLPYVFIQVDPERYNNLEKKVNELVKKNSYVVLSHLTMFIKPYLIPVLEENGFDAGIGRLGKIINIHSLNVFMMGFETLIRSINEDAKLSFEWGGYWKDFPKRMAHHIQQIIKEPNEKTEPGALEELYDGTEIKYRY